MTASVLIVEDEGLIAEDLRDQVEALGHRVTDVVSSIDDALAVIRRAPPDVVLMDIRVQGDGDGIDAAVEIGDQASVIFLTAHSDPGTLERAMLTRPSAYLVKPVRPTELASAIQAACDRRAAAQRYEAIESHFRRLLEYASDIVLRLSPAGQLLYANPAGRRALGLTGSVASRRLAVLADLTHPDDQVLLAKALVRATQDEAVVSVRFRLRRPFDELRVEGVLSARRIGQLDVSVWAILNPVTVCGAVGGSVTPPARAAGTLAH